MLQTVEAEMDVNGDIRLLKPLHVTAPRRVLVTLLPENGATAAMPASFPESGQPIAATRESRRQEQMAWLKANAESHGGQYVALVGQQLISTGATFRAAHEAACAAGCADAFVTYLPKPDEMLEMGGWL
ncbi:MAG: hypothetical protein HOP19_07045 [Acidobacteria bacterium]|nr:hypothetical protein [Acidobacteriota bacterium]